VSISSNFRDREWYELGKGPDFGNVKGHLLKSLTTGPNVAGKVRSVLAGESFVLGASLSGRWQHA